ncbi:MAG: hypothetical protein KBS96_03630 [Lachnospiraceae bacterium]|nr:hypothetical protein [Candidatus Colinaster scatohippi]
MKKSTIRWVIITITFVISLVLSFIFLNKGTTDMTVNMSMPSLPVAYINIDGYKVNEMHGYTTRMESSTLRDSVTPIGDDRAVSFIIDKYETGITGLSVEVRSADGNRLIEDTPIILYNDYNNTLETTVFLKDLIDEGREYNLTLVLKLTDGRSVFYYTKIVQNEEANVAQKVAFATDFCNKTFNKDNIKELSTYMESNSDGDNTTLAHVDIHSSMNQVTWANLKPIIQDDIAVTIEEIGKTMASLELRYMVKIKEENDVHYYNVTEYYRIRITNQRTYLLSFNRKMSEILQMDSNKFVNDKIVFGIQSNPMQVVESAGGDILVFENDGRLYCYNAVDNKLVRLFAFYDSAEDDYRCRYRGSDVKILNVEENGNVAFMVYGYMCRGTHEGEVGAEVFYYDSVLNTIEEQVFLPYYGYEEILKFDMEKLSYLNSSGNAYVFFDGVVYKVMPKERKYSVVASNINEDTFFVSKSGRTIVWQEKNEKDMNDIRSDLTVMSLMTGITNTVSKGASEYVKPIGFMNEDLIYGISEKKDLIHNRLGDITVPMNRVIIQSEKGDVLKEYSENGIYVTGGTIEANQITLERIRKNPDTGEYIYIEDDHITNNATVDAGKNNLMTVVTENYEKIVQMQLKSMADPKTMKMLTPMEVIYEGGRSVELKSVEDKERFIVYGDGVVEGIYDKPAKAVACAYDIRGTVIDIYGNEIYRRGETVSRNQIMAIGEASTTETKNSLTVCLDTMLRLQGISRNTEYMLDKGDSVYDVLSKNLNNVYVLNLTGCSMDMMLYYVNLDIPVLAIRNDGSTLLIIGFNEQNIVVMDPNEGTIYKIGMNDSREMFEMSGNKFMTYSIRYDEKPAVTY